MNRRNFLAGLGALVGGLAIEQAIPLGRVWSFPSKTTRCTTINFRIPMRFASSQDMTAAYIRNMEKHLKESLSSEFFDPHNIYIHPAQRDAYLELGNMRNQASTLS